MTILEAIKAVMRDAGKPMSAVDVFNEIRARGLYHFKAKDAQALVTRELRRHCEGLQLKTGAEFKCFRVVHDPLYQLLPAT